MLWILNIFVVLPNYETYVLNSLHGDKYKFL